MLQHVVQVPLRWVDLDAQGHVNNALFADYLQEARAGYFATGDAAAMVGGGVVVVKHQIEYSRPIVFHPEPLQVRVGLVDVGASRFTVAYELVQFGEVCARARTLLCPFDFATGRPRRLTETERGWFVSQVQPMEPLRPLATPSLHGAGHVHPVQVRWSDLDPYNHVNNVRYFDYVQEARIAMTVEADPGMARAGEDSMWVVARQDLDYLAQMGFRTEPFAVHSAPVKLGNTSLTLVAEVVDPHRESLVLARARTVLVHTDGTGAPRPLPDSAREAMQQRLVGEVRAR